MLNKYLKCSVWRLAVRYDLYLGRSAPKGYLFTACTLLNGAWVLRIKGCTCRFLCINYGSMVMCFLHYAVVYLTAVDCCDSNTMAHCSRPLMMFQTSIHAIDLASSLLWRRVTSVRRHLRVLCCCNPTTPVLADRLAWRLTETFMRRKGNTRDREINLTSNRSRFRKEGNTYERD
jgi:hypothetical protein